MQWSAFTLTSHRVFKQQADWAESVLLQHVSGTSIDRKHAPRLLVLAVLLVLGSYLFGQRMPEIGMITMVGAVVCMVGYLMSRRIAVRVYAGRQELGCLVAASDVRAGREFADAVEQAASLALRAPGVVQRHGAGL